MLEQKPYFLTYGYLQTFIESTQSNLETYILICNLNDSYVLFWDLTGYMPTHTDRHLYIQLLCYTGPTIHYTKNHF